VFLISSLNRTTNLKNTYLWTSCSVTLQTYLWNQPLLVLFSGTYSKSCTGSRTTPMFGKPWYLAHPLGQNLSEGAQKMKPEGWHFDRQRDLRTPLRTKVPCCSSSQHRDRISAKFPFLSDQILRERSTIAFSLLTQISLAREDQTHFTGRNTKVCPLTSRGLCHTALSSILVPQSIITNCCLSYRLNRLCPGTLQVPLKTIYIPHSPLPCRKRICRLLSHVGLLANYTMQSYSAFSVHGKICMSFLQLICQFILVTAGSLHWGAGPCPHCGAALLP
jgi:hypothetical protein